MSAAILLTHPRWLEVLERDGGLRSSFLAIFRGALSESVGGADHPGLDALLEGHRLVGFDPALLDPVEDRDLMGLRDTLLHQVVSRGRFWLEIVEGGPEDQCRILESLGHRIRALAPPRGETVTPGNVVVVFLDPIAPEARGILTVLGDSVPGVGAVYVMAHQLQPGDGGRSLLQARHVWPDAVGRLVAARVLIEGQHRPGDSRPRGVFTWRTVLWGAHEAEEWRQHYRTLLEGGLNGSRETPGHMPPGPAVPREPLLDPLRDSEVKIEHPPVPPLDWGSQPEDLRMVGLDAIRHTRFEQELESAGLATSNIRAVPVLRHHWENLRNAVVSGWAMVGDPRRGLPMLRRLARGDGWQVPSIDGTFEEQRRRWSEMVHARRRLAKSRQDQKEAVRELVRARDRHLSLIWRLVIAGVVMLFVGQFLTSLLLPLRPPPRSSKSTGPELLGNTLKGKTIGFLVDRSSSMEGERIERLKAGLTNCLASMTNRENFSIVAFDQDMESMPVGNGRMVESTPENRRLAIEWVQRLAVGGGTAPSKGLAHLMAQNPDTIVLLTDGEFSDGDKVRDLVTAAIQAGRPAFQTIALFERGEEPFLKAIAERTGGEYRFVAFDPFSPVGFGTVTTIILCATALGAALGAFLPWWLERWRGVVATGCLRDAVSGLWKQFAIAAVDTQRLIHEMFSTGIQLPGNEAAIQQTLVASRGQSALDVATAQIRDPGKRGASGGAAEPLERRNRKMWSDALTIRCVGAGPGIHGAAGPALQDLVDRDTQALRVGWSRLCERHDTGCRGNLPLRAMETEFAVQLQNCIEQAAHLLLLGEDRERGGDCASLEEIGAQLLRRLRDESPPSFLSACVVNNGGQWPERAVYWVAGLRDSGEPRWPLDANETVFTGLRRQLCPTTLIRLESQPDIGVIALALMHEEIRIVLPTHPEWPSRHDAIVYLPRK